MKRVISLLLLCTLVFSLVGCKSEPEQNVRELSCYDIAEVYRNNGFTVFHGEHNKEGASYLCDVICESTNDTVCFTTFFTAEDALVAHEKGQYHIVLWFYSSIMGESRWLKCDNYGKITYTYYDKNSLAPFNLLKTLEVM